jgi:hypothetical protein
MCSRCLTDRRTRIYQIIIDEEVCVHDCHHCHHYRHCHRSCYYHHSLWIHCHQAILTTIPRSTFHDSQYYRHHCHRYHLSPVTCHHCQVSPLSLTIAPLPTTFPLSPLRLPLFGSRVLFLLPLRSLRTYEFEHSEETSHFNEFSRSKCINYTRNRLEIFWSEHISEISLFLRSRKRTTCHNYCFLGFLARRYPFFLFRNGLTQVNPSTAPQHQQYTYHYLSKKLPKSSRRPQIFSKIDSFCTRCELRYYA